MSINKVVWEPGLTYHITTRGNRRNDIFRAEEHFEIYLSILENNLVYYSSLNYRLVAYCLMDNHVYLIIQTDKESLKRFMARLKEVSRYVHLNLVKARMVEWLDEYK